MSVTVFDHQHDAPLVLAGVGTNGVELIIQTGTIVLNFLGVFGEGWIRDRLSYPVLDLSIGGISPFGGASVRAIASAAPASMNYSPPAAAGIVGGLAAKGNVVLGGWADSVGTVSVAGPAFLPVVAVAPGGGAAVPVAGAGWAVDRTHATHVQNHIELVVDLAVAGPSSLMRLAYSLFVTITPRTVLEVDRPGRVREP